MISPRDGLQAEDAEDRMWQALADRSRRSILDMLRQGPATTGEVAERLAAERGLSRFAAMKHLGVLEDAGLVTVRREGKLRWNYANAAPFVAAYRRWVSAFAALPGGFLYDLKAYAEGRREPPGAGGEERP